MPDQTMTSRDVIRAAAEAYFREGHGEWLANLDGLAERIDRALFDPRTDGRVWQLHAEIRKALYVTRLGEVMGHGVMDTEVPLLAAILREPAQPEGPPGR